MKYKLIRFLAFISIFIVCGQGAEYRYLKFIAQLPAPGSTIRVGFASHDDGWAFSRSKLWRTQDHGKTWVEQSLPQIQSSIPSIINNVQFFGYRGVILLGRDLFATVDDGHTWTALPLKPIERNDAVIEGFRFTGDGHVGWAYGGLWRAAAEDEKAPTFAMRLQMGRREILVPFILRTEDAGQTWVVGKLPNLAPSVMGHQINGLSFYNGSRAIASTENCALHTTNGGVTWRAGQFKDHLCAVGMEQSGLLRLAGVTAPFDAILSPLDGSVLRTIDGGRVWMEIGEPGTIRSQFSPQVSSRLVSIAFLSPKVGWAVDMSSLLLQTDDRGKTWVAIGGPVKRFFQVISMASGAPLVVDDEGLNELALPNSVR